MAVAGGGKAKAMTLGEHHVDQLMMVFAAHAQRVVGVFVAAVTRTDLPRGLTDRVVSVFVASGPADVVGRCDGALGDGLLNQCVAAGEDVAAEDRQVRPRHVHAFMARSRVHLSGPFIGMKGREMARVVITVCHGFEVRPFAGAGALSEE